MQAATQATTPTITPEELIKRMADPETYQSALLHCWARSVPRQATRARSVHLYHLKAQRQAPATTRHSGVRLWLPVKKERQCQMKQRLISSARSSSSHLPRPSSSTRWKAVSCRLEQLARMSRKTFASPFVMAGMLAWLAGGRMILSSQTRPLGPKNPKTRDSQRTPKTVTHLLCISKAVVVYCSTRRRRCRMVIGV